MLCRSSSRFAALLSERLKLYELCRSQCADMTWRSCGVHQFARRVVASANERDERLSIDVIAVGHTVSGCSFFRARRRLRLLQMLQCVDGCMRLSILELATNASHEGCAHDLSVQIVKKLPRLS